MERYSYSKLSSFENCKYGFYLNYFEKNKNRENHGTSEFGSFMHEILEDYANGKLAEYEMLDKYLKEYDDNVISTFVLKLSNDFSKDMSYNYFNAGKEYLETFDGFLPNLEILEVEYEFEEIVNDNFVLVGKIDLVAKDENGDIVIIDHKSKGKFKNKKEKAEYAKQLYIYALAIERKYGKLPKTLMFNMFKQKEWEIFDFNEVAYKEATSWMVNRVEEIESCFEFDAIGEGFFCDNFCSYRHICDKKI